jgi:hypothetical protein
MMPSRYVNSSAETGGGRAGGHFADFASPC